METVTGQSGTVELSTPVQFLKGVGPQRAELLARLGLHTAQDMLFFFPRDYQDMLDVLPISHLEEDQLASIRGTVEEVELRNTGPGRSMLGVLIRQGNDYLRAVWFNQPYMQQRFARGQHVLLSGTARRRGLRWEMAHPRVQTMDEGEANPSGSILAVYPLTEGIKQFQLRRIVHSVVEACAQLVPEVFPDEFLDDRRLWPIRAALPQVHAPSDRTSLQQAQRRFVYQELLVLQLALALRRQGLHAECRAEAIPMSARIDARVRRLFPFALTPGQQQAIGEITQDMAREVPMNRLLQGDVGSGKTIVAVYAMLTAVAHGFQTALMAPTEVLARQHFATLQNLLAQSHVRLGLLTGSLGAAERKSLLADIAKGEVDLVVGTQAIVQADVEFARLGLAVVDEQHKFGVRQRARLRRGKLDPHYLVMTATPIPRTVSMAMFGDLDTSTLRDSPPGRQQVHTYLARQQQRDRWWQFFCNKLREGRQGYVITPLIDESERVDVASVEQAFEALANGHLHAFRLDLVHGRMSADQKHAAMEAFRSGQTQVLVATSVVEVGVDVPNANLMTIENGERFGLAQLHQLRGRVSRSNHPGYVCIFAEPRTDEAHRRLQAVVETNDGFQLAEQDFQLRGPGELFGTRQHGMPPLRVADLQRDTQLLEEARRDAQALVARDPGLQAPQYASLRRMVLVRYGQALDLSDVG